MAMHKIDFRVIMQSTDAKLRGCRPLNGTGFPT